MLCLACRLLIAKKRLPLHSGEEHTARAGMPGRVVIWAVPNASRKRLTVMRPWPFAFLLMLSAAARVRSAPTERAERGESESAKAVFPILFSPPMPNATVALEYEQADT